MVYDPNSTDLLVGECGGGVQPVPTTNMATSPAVHVGGLTAAIAIASDTGDPFVLNWNPNSVAILTSNTSEVSTFLPLGGAPNAVAVDSATGTAFVASSGNTSVINVSNHRQVGSIPVGLGWYYGEGTPEGILFDPASQEVFVANSGNDTVSVISTQTNSLVTTVTVAAAPLALAWNNETNVIYVTCLNVPLSDLLTSDAVLDVISTASLKVVANVSLGSIVPDGIAYVPSLNEIFVDNNAFNLTPPFSSPSLKVISALTNETVATIPLPANASTAGEAVFDNVTGDLYIAGAGMTFYSNDTDDLVVNPTSQSVVGNISVGLDPNAITPDPGSPYLFVAAGVNDTVSLIDAATGAVISSAVLPPGAFPQGLAYDQATGQVLAADWSNDSLSYLVPKEVYPVAFTENGLPAGLNWSVTVNGTSWPSNSSTLIFPEPNGTYSYSIASADQQYQSLPVTGSFTVAGAALAQSVEFQLVVYSVTFTESGLPEAGGWYANVTGQLSVYSTTATASLNLPNGTYNYSIGTGDMTFTATGGSLTINGGPASASVEFSRVTFSVTFTESGLPSGTTWTVMINGTLKSGTGSLTFELPNGTYAWEITSLPNGNTATPSAGTITVDGGPTLISVAVASSVSTHSGHMSVPTPLWVWILIGAIIIAAAATVVVAIYRHKPQSPLAP